jgi:hypothetical protein
MAAFVALANSDDNYIHDKNFSKLGREKWITTTGIKKKIFINLNGYDNFLYNLKKISDDDKLLLNANKASVIGLTLLDIVKNSKLLLNNSYSDIKLIGIVAVREVGKALINKKFIFDGDPNLILIDDSVIDSIYENVRLTVGDSNVQIHKDKKLVIETVIKRFSECRCVDYNGDDINYSTSFNSSNNEHGILCRDFIHTIGNSLISYNYSDYYHNGEEKTSEIRKRQAEKYNISDINYDSYVSKTKIPEKYSYDSKTKIPEKYSYDSDDSYNSHDSRTRTRTRTKTKDIEKKQEVGYNITSIDDVDD